MEAVGSNPASRYYHLRFHPLYVIAMVKFYIQFLRFSLPSGMVRARLPGAVD